LSTVPWQPGSLWPKLKAQRKHGLRTGDLQPVETVTERIDSGDMRFVVHVLANLARKEKALKAQKIANANPFLPYEPNLYVSDISETHLCLLNKYNVVDHHFLIVTRQFEPQDNWLTLADFEALALALSEVDGLAFYNGGTAAGSSQPHKHLQVVPSAGNMTLNFPLVDVIAAAPNSMINSVKSAALPFRHAIVHLSDHQLPTSSAIDLAQQYLASYHQLLSAVNIASASQWQGRQTAPYNLLCTRAWMMLIPRRQEKFANISVNSLGFAGSLLVKDAETLLTLKKIDPVNLLQQVSFAN
jgi:sulfate adenylyltransferase (ADP) / ATP adenylyltransferase